MKNELGDQEASRSYWAQMTKDVLPNSRNKPFREQQALLQGSYAAPEALEAAVMILMHHVKEGEKLYRPHTYTRCQEKVCNKQYRVVVGSYGSSGLIISFDYYDSIRVPYFGLGGLRKF